MQHKSIHKTPFLLSVKITPRHNVQKWANPQYIADLKKQLVNFGCKEMQTSGRKFIKSYGLADAVTARIFQWQTFLTLCLPKKFHANCTIGVQWTTDFKKKYLAIKISHKSTN